MKQELISYLSLIQDDIFKLSRYLYENPEDGYKEHNAYNCIIKLLSAYNFEVKKQFLKIPTSFLATYGKGYPNICLLCEYDAAPTMGHIYGNNMSTAMSIGTGLVLTKVLNKLEGTISIIGCPGSTNDSSLATMEKQGVFKDVDVVLQLKPHTLTAKIASSPALLPLKILFNKDEDTSSNFSSLDGCLYAFNTINSLIKAFTPKCSIEDIKIDGTSNKCEGSFIFKAQEINLCESIKAKTIELIKPLDSTFNITSQVSLNDMDFKEIRNSDTLNRLFYHNLKENGIIDEIHFLDVDYPVNIGRISHIIPCLFSFISTVEDSNIEYPSIEFGRSTVSSYGETRLLSAIKALALTSIDLFEKNNLIQESKLGISKKL